MSYCLKEFVKDINDPALKFEIEIIISNFLNINRIDIYLSPEIPLIESKLNELRSLISRRLNGEPLAYILGYAHFRDLKLNVGPGVLIPRPETEKMIELAKEFIVSNSRILDVGTGSGAIALSVAKEFPETKVIGVDISKNALLYAEKNRKFNNISNVQFCLNDLCSGFTPSSFDIILANLPYIPCSNYLNLEKDVKEFEPKLALTPGETGLELIEKLICQSKIVLKPSGIIILEIDKDQGETVRNIFKSLDEFCFSEILKDYNGLDRFVLSQKSK